MKPRWDTPHDARWEIGLVVALELINVLVLITGLLPWEGRFSSPGPWIAILVQFLVTPIFLWRRAFPTVIGSIAMVTVLVVTLCAPVRAGGGFPLLLSYDAWLPFVGSLTSNTLIHFGGRSRRGWIVWGLLVVVTAVAIRPWDLQLGVVYGGVGLAAVPALLGAYLAARSRLIRELRDRAERAERDRALAAGQARTQERIRLAADLHDVVTHRISLMVLQAGAVRMSTADPAVRSSAEELRTVGCEALEELRDMIGVLRIQARETP
jgi:signal transduction histidine kinase